MVPTIGRVVHYRLRYDQADEINRRRKHAADNYHLHAHQKLGVQLHTGNMMKPGQVVPMLIVQVWGEQPTSCVNGVAFPDGSDPYWVTSVACGEREGEFTWPVPQQTVAAEGE